MMQVLDVGSSDYFAKELELLLFIFHSKKNQQKKCCGPSFHSLDMKPG